jgi:hypothetical protein
MTDRRLLFTLVLFEAGMSLLAMLGGALFMGGAWWYIVCGLLIAALYVVAGQAAASGRRWGPVTLIVIECLRLTGFGISAVIGLLPWVQLTLTGATLVDSLILPTIVAVMAAIQLIRPPVPPMEPAPAPLAATLELVA